MICPNCNEEVLIKSGILDYNLYTENKITIEWEAYCPKCDYDCFIEEDFKSVGNEREVE